ncbi:MAG: head GIN domain-containing protein [Bacteroidota bacterium]
MRAIPSILFLLLLTVIGTELLGQKSESIEPSYFTSLKVVGRVFVDAQQGESNVLELEAVGISMDKVQVSTSKGELKIKVSPVFAKDYHINAKLTYTSLEKIHASAGADIDIQDVIKGEYLELHAGSGAEIDLEAEATEIYQRAGEGAFITISGTAQKAEIKASTGGGVYGDDFEAGTVLAKVSTGGEVSIQVKDYLDVHSSTGGEFVYAGNPEKMRTASSLGGTIIRE